MNFKNYYLNSDTYKEDYFKQFIGNEKWKNIIECPICDLNYHFGVIGEYDNINKYEGQLSGGRSQNGEDGLLKHIFDILDIQYKYCIEFGAGNGEELSNTYYFRKTFNWDSLLLEGNNNLVLQGNNNGEKTLYNEFITLNNINELFEKYNVPKNIDLLSIDIDSIDYFVLKKLDINKFCPNVIIIEINAGLPNNVPLIMDPNYKSNTNIWYFGVNLHAIYDLAIEKGYEFLTTVRWNAIFVKKELFHKFNIPIISKDECIKNYFKPNNYQVSLILKYLNNQPKYLTY